MKSRALTCVRSFNTRLLGAVAAAAIMLAPVYARAQSAPGYANIFSAPPPSYANAYSAPSAANGYAGGVFRSWLDMVSASQAAQPSWMTPLVTVTPRLEQEFRWDVYDQQNGNGSQGNGQHIVNYGGPGGPRIEFIPAYNWEVIVATSSYVTASGPKGAAEGWSDWPAFLVKYRIASANEQNGNYIVTAFFQMTDPLGTPAKISNNVLTAQPTLAVGKGWGDFDIQSTVSVQVPVSALSSPGNTPQMNMTNFGDPILWNTAFQYHLFKYFWPELEVNYEYWPNGEHQGLSQVLLTPGLILGRFQIGNDTPTRPINLIIGAGYQVAVTPNPVTSNNFVGTMRITF
jgi:hypothetical protein